MTDSLAKLRVISRNCFNFPSIITSWYATNTGGLFVGAAAGAAGGGGGGGGGTGVGSADCGETAVAACACEDPPVEPRAARSSRREVAASSLQTPSDYPSSHRQ